MSTAATFCACVTRSADVKSSQTSSSNLNRPPKICETEKTDEAVVKAVELRKGAGDVWGEIDEMIAKRTSEMPRGSQRGSGEKTRRIKGNG